VHKLLAKQLRNVTDADGKVDADKLVAIVERTYEEFDRERRLNDRASKLMEEELMAANDVIRLRGEQRLTGTLESAPCALALVDAQWVMQNVNTAMAWLCGKPHEALIGRPCFAALAEASSDIPPGMLERLHKGQTVECEIGGRWYLAEARGLGDGSWALALSDVTALKERETALLLARDSAESANRLKSHFLATMSHELRTPLNAILGFSEIVREKMFGRGEEACDRYADYAASIHTCGAHLLELISDVLDLSKIDAGSFALNHEPLDLGVVTNAVLELVAPQAQGGSVTLVPFTSSGSRMIEADSRAVKQILLNLLANAVKFTPAGGEVDVTMQPDGGDVLVTVRDTGIGIAPEHLESVFEAFHQGDPRVSRRFEGTGLGLSITKRLVEQHDGTIWIESELGSGTRVMVRLPRRAVKPEQQAAVAPKPVRAPRTQRPSKVRATATTR
jgi:signal transduction histidine kinase